MPARVVLGALLATAGTNSAAAGAQTEKRECETCPALAAASLARRPPRAPPPPPMRPADYEDILEEFPGNATAKAGLARIKAEQTAKEEKLKEEMMGKLKDMGNSLLGHFGLSVDNFKFDKDPKTGGYNINFQQGAPPPAGGDGEPKPPASG